MSLKNYEPMKKYVRYRQGLPFNINSGANQRLDGSTLVEFDTINSSPVIWPGNNFTFIEDGLYQIVVKMVVTINGGSTGVFSFYIRDDGDPVALSYIGNSCNEPGVNVITASGLLKWEEANGNQNIRLVNSTSDTVIIDGIDISFNKVV